jgi:hypothetical protein
MSATNTKRLREMLAAATPVPWRVAAVVTSGDDIPAAVSAVGHLVALGAYPDTYARNPKAAENVDLIVAVCNALPAMLDEMDALRAVADATRGHIQTAGVRRALAALDAGRDAALPVTGEEPKG